MDTDAYIAAIATAVRQAISHTLALGPMIQRGAITTADWLMLLQVLYPMVVEQRTAAAAAARTYYDAQRRLYLPGFARNDNYLGSYSFQQFAADMNSVKKSLMVEKPSQESAGRVAAQVARAVENGGRHQIINAVDGDKALMDLQSLEEKTTTQVTKVIKPPQPKAAAVTKLGQEIKPPTPKVGEPKKTTYRTVRGWARVATGRETCAWCLMLISRGPIYKSSSNAGLNVDSTSATQAYKRAGSDLASFLSATEGKMNQWHPNCDCKVIPVFSTNDWPGREQYLLAQTQWLAASKRVQEANKGKPSSEHDSTLNNLRQKISSDPSIVEKLTLS